MKDVGRRTYTTGPIQSRLILPGDDDLLFLANNGISESSDVEDSGDDNFGNGRRRTIATSRPIYPSPDHLPSLIPSIRSSFIV